MQSLWSLLKRRPGFRNLWLGETTSLLGDWLSYVAISLLALHSGGGAMALAVVFAGHLLPAAMVSPLAGVLADRVDRRKVLIGTQLVQAALMFLMVIAASYQHLLAVQGLLFARTAVAGFFYPAKQAALRRVVEPDELLDANAIDAATWSVMFAAGTAMGGVLALAGPVVALTVDMFTFLLAAMFLARLAPLDVDGRTHSSTISPRAAFDELREASSFAWRRPELAEAVLAKTPTAVAGGAAWVLLNLTADTLGLLGSAALALGLLQAVRGTGTGIGPLAARKLVARGIPAMHLLRASMAITFVGIAAFTGLAWIGGTGWQLWLPLLAAAFVWGVGGGGGWVFSASEIQRRAPDAMQGRLSSVDQLAFMLGSSGGALVAGLLVDVTHVSAHAGLLGVVAGGVLWLALLLATVYRRDGATQPSSLAVQRP
jgi:MFS family permease